MGNIAFAWINLFDTATITTSSAASGCPASNLQQEDVYRKWRGTNGDTETITATWATDQTADTFGLFGIGDQTLGITALERFLATGTTWLQLTANGGPLGGVYDSLGPNAGLVDPRYGSLIHALGQAYTFRSATCSLSQVGAAYIEAGRGMVGLRTVVEYNPPAGAGRTVVDPSVKRKTHGGQTKITIRPQYRVQEFELSWITEAQRWSLVEAMDLANGAHRDVLMMFNPASSNLGRDSIWGLMEAIDPVTLIGLFDSAGGLMASRRYKIEERL